VSYSFEKRTLQWTELTLENKLIEEMNSPGRRVTGLPELSILLRIPPSRAQCMHGKPTFESIQVTLENKLIEEMNIP
jgi:hypothetical protein